MNMPASAQPERGASLRRATPEHILQRIDWQVIRRLDGLLQGDYRSLFYGYGVDFADLREYQPEDDIRYIDWNVTARMDTPYVRQYIEDREVTAWFLLDLSPSVDFGALQHPKRAVLIDFVATVARLLTRHGNRVGAMLYDSHQLRTIPASGGRLQVLRIVNDLLKQARPGRAPLTDLRPLIQGGLHAIKKRSLVFLVSDFISAPGWDRPLRLLNQRHEVTAVQLWDPREMELPDIGQVIMEDAETGEQLYVDTGDIHFRARYQEAARQRQDALNETFVRAGADMLALSTEEDLVRAIARFAAFRKQRRAGERRGRAVSAAAIASRGGAQRGGDRPGLREQWQALHQASQSPGFQPPASSPETQERRQR